MAVPLLAAAASGGGTAAATGAAAGGATAAPVAAGASTPAAAGQLATSGGSKAIDKWAFTKNTNAEYEKHLESNGKQLGKFQQGMQAVNRGWDTIKEKLGAVGKAFDWVRDKAEMIGGVFLTMADLGNAAIAGGDKTQGRSKGLLEASFGQIFAPFAPLVSASMIALGEIIRDTVVPAAKGFGDIIREHGMPIMRILFDVLLKFGEITGKVVKIIFAVLGWIIEKFHWLLKWILPDEFGSGKGAKTFDKSMGTTTRQLEREYNKAAAGNTTGFGTVDSTWEKMQKAYLDRDEISMEQLNIQKQTLQHLREVFPQNGGRQSDGAQDKALRFKR